MPNVFFCGCVSLFNGIALSYSAKEKSCVDSADIKMNV